MVKIRLSRHGAKKAPFYRIVVIDSRKARDGKAIEEIGRYNPRTDPIFIEIDLAKYNEWIGKGAQPTDVVKRLAKTAAEREAAQ